MSMKKPKDDAKVPEGLNLTAEEQAEVRKRLGRAPNSTEWGMIDVMWSEHCSYKSSRPVLKLLPTSNKHVVVGPGFDAGVVDIGDGWCAAFKIESHNHPSAIDPYSGAATGVGGIIRDILSMGAQPIAMLDSIHFGSIKSAHSQWLLKNVVKGIGDYGNCVGIPTVAGEVQFDNTFEGNCIVNCACVGFVRKENIMYSKAKEPGDLLILVGGSTGRDGIHGVTFASRNLDEGSEGDRPAVQIPDPFTKKLIIDATLEVLATGKVKALKDLGGGGLTCASSEMCAKGGLGAEIDISKINAREPNMKPFEIMLSESQERMLFEVSPDDAAVLTDIFDKYSLVWRVIGTVQKGDYVIKNKDELVAQMDAKLLAEAPTEERKNEKPKYIEELKALKLPDEPMGLSNALLTLLSSENISSKIWVYEQYDHEVGDRSTVKCGRADAAVMLAPNGKGVALKADSNSLACYLDPYNGGAGIICENVRNLACVGGRAIAMVDNLNFGNPEKPGIAWQFRECVRGISDACKEFDLASVGGNVSFYNEDEQRGLAVKPTPVIISLGVVDDLGKVPASGFSEREEIVLVGEVDSKLGGSEYLRVVHEVEGCEAPAVDMKAEKKAVDFVLDAIGKGLVSAAHDVSKGGLAVAIAEMCISGKTGADVKVEGEGRADALLFSEGGVRFVLGTRDSAALLKLAGELGVKARVAGKAGGTDVRLSAGGKGVKFSVEKARTAYKGSIRL